MKTQEVIKVGKALEDIGHAQTSFADLGIADFEAMATDLRVAVEGSEQYKAENAGDRSGVLMFRDELSLELGRRLAERAINVLFSGDQESIDGMEMYAINHYVTGNYFRPHQDYFDGTVVITTIMGHRQFDVYRKEPEDDEFVEIVRTYDLTAGTIVLLNGYKDLGHAARCVQGPSMSVVCDTPGRVNTI